MNHEREDIDRSSATSTRRYWRRADEPVGGWWPWGLLPLLGLLATLAYGLLWTVPETQAETQNGVASALAAADYDELAVVADGQHVVIRGSADAGEATRIASIARGASCNTFLARGLVCPTRVDVELDAPARADPEPEPPAPVAASDTAAAAVPQYVLSFRQQDNSLVLDGEVPTETIRDNIVARARQNVAAVIDNLDVTGGEPSRDLDWAASRALDILPLMQNGGVTWRDGKLTAWGEVTSVDAASVRQSFAAEGGDARLGRLDLTILSREDECNARFSAALAESTIRFSTGSAAIAAESVPVLERLAALADECELALDVEGHTDDVGSPAGNRRLSLARAEAVSAALEGLGVDGALLNARGYGPDRPIADNVTADGRARNRRIEIRASAESPADVDRAANAQ